MKKILILTGACGHLGGAILRLTQGKGYAVRALALAEETPLPYPNVTYFRGDVRDADSLRPLFAHASDEEISVIHAAGIVEISDRASPRMVQVNVQGTRSVLALCKEYGARRLVHVSSVHALPELQKDKVQKEIGFFSPDAVQGGYAKTKAEATQLVLDAAKAGLDAVVVQPSGILGPYESRGNHLVQMVRDYLAGRLPACVQGEYDFVDVRDVADGCLRALDRGRSGECYILSNRPCAVRDVLAMVRRLHGGRALPVLPLWLARAALPLMHLLSRLRRTRPLYTRYSLHTLSANDNFSHEKATRELGYRPRDLLETLRDTVLWITAPAAFSPA
jgi:dihydroflavonol-4-reductase